MFAKTEYMFLLLLVLITANASQAMASSPRSFLVVPKVKTELTFVETPEYYKWSKVHLKATALNDLPLPEVSIRVSDGFTFSVRPPNGVWPVWKNTKQGNVLECDFQIHPNNLGALRLDISYGIVSSVYFVSLDDSGKAIFIGTFDEALKKAGIYEVKYDAEGTRVFSDKQRANIRKILPQKIESNDKTKTIISDKFVEYYYGPVRVTITPPPVLDQKSEVKIEYIPTYEKEDYVPNLLIDPRTNVECLGLENTKSEFYGRQYTAIKGLGKNKENIYNTTITMIPKQIIYNILRFTITTINNYNEESPFDFETSFQFTADGKLRKIDTTTITVKE